MRSLLLQVQLVSCDAQSVPPCKAVQKLDAAERKSRSQARLIKNLVCAQATGRKESCCVTKVLANTTVMTNEQQASYNLPLKAW